MLLPSPEEIPAGPSGARRRLPVLLMAVVGGGIGYAAASWLLEGRLLDLFPTEGLSASEVALLGTGGLLVVWLILLVHELGHVMGGLAVGFRFQLLVVGLLRLERDGTGLHWRWNLNPGYMGGLAAMVPVEEINLRQRMLIMVAGGPVSSLVFGATALALAFLMPVPSSLIAVLRALTGLFGVASLVIAMVTLVPGRTSGFLTDGARILQLLRDTPKSRRDLALLALSAHSMGGRRPREWDPDLLKNCLEVDDRSIFRLGGLLMNYLNAADVGDWERATGTLGLSLGLMPALPPATHPTLAYEAAFHAGLHGEGDLARRWLEWAAAKPSMDQGSRARAEAVVSQSADEQARWKAQAVQELSGGLDRGAAVYYLEKLAALPTPGN